MNWLNSVVKEKKKAALVESPSSVPANYDIVLNLDSKVIQPQLAEAWLDKYTEIYGDFTDDDP